MPYEHWKELVSHTLPDEYFEKRAALSAADLRAIQDEGLRDQFAYAFERVSMYKQKFTAAGLAPRSIRGGDDLTKLPFTTVDDIRPVPSRGYTTAQVSAVPQREVSLMHASSGTTGGPKLFPYTGGDMAKWAGDTAFMLWIAGLRKTDIVACAMPFGEFSGGAGLYLGFTALGVTYIPISVGPGTVEKMIAHFTGSIRLDEQQIPLDPLQKANAFLALPAFIPRLLEAMAQKGLTAKDLLVNKIATGGEPSSDALRERIYDLTGIKARDVFGLGEFYGPGNAAECSAGDCLHMLSDEFIAEILDPETGAPVAEGEMGELVMTSLHKEALPLLRYRTGDRVRALSQHCECGLAHFRMGRIPGRISADDIVLPGAIVANRTFLEDVLLRVNGTGAEYAVTVAEPPNRKGVSRLYIAIEGPQEHKADTARAISERVLLEYGSNAVVEILPRGTIPRAPGKAKRVFTPAEFAQLLGGRLPDA